MNPLRIALVAPMVAPISDREPPLGGGQALLADLASALASAGHHVTLLAAPGSAVRGVEVVQLGVDTAALRPARFQPGEVRRDLEPQRAAFARVAAWLREHASGFDVVHAHAFDAPAFEALSAVPLPVVHTLHLPPIEATVVDAAIQARRAGASLVAVSETSAADWRAAGVAIDRVVPNGVDVAAIPFGERARGYLLSAGRLTPEKGVDVAIRVAARAHLPLVVAGNVYDQAYFEHAVRPYLTDQPSWQPGQPLPAAPVYIGHRRRADLHQVMAAAIATLLPIGWDEPFGLAAVESQAAGAPVAGYARGALREVVDNGRTGVLVPPADEDALTDALDRIVHLSRAGCRTWVKERFSVGAMVQACVALYAAMR